MDVYRIHNRKYAPLDGMGAALAGGRWNPIGAPIVYAAATFEGALIEQLVHAGIGALPTNRQASRIRIPDDMEIPSLRPGDVPDWPQELSTRQLGREWLEDGESVALIVPSVVARPWGQNVLINPGHPDFRRVALIEAVDVVWDPRLGSASK